MTDIYLHFLFAHYGLYGDATHWFDVRQVVQSFPGILAFFFPVVPEVQPRRVQTRNRRLPASAPLIVASDWRQSLQLLRVFASSIRCSSSPAESWPDEDEAETQVSLWVSSIDAAPIPPSTAGAHVPPINSIMMESASPPAFC